MALLICFSETPETVDWRDKAIYLDHGFYTLIFNCCRPDGGQFPILGTIASLDYGGDLTLDADQCDELIAELTQLQKRGGKHSQILPFVLVCQQVIQREFFLWISGDMYPVLSDSNKFHFSLDHIFVGFMIMASVCLLILIGICFFY